MRRTIALLFIISTAFLEYENLQACSVCRCGEGMMLCSANPSDSNSQALNGLPNRGKFRFQFQNLLLSKSNGLSPDPAPTLAAAKLAQVADVTGSETEREFRPSIRANYGITNSLTTSAELPYSFKRITQNSSAGTSVSTSSGLGDVELSLAWCTPLAFNKQTSWSIGFTGTMKAPTGSNNAQGGGARLDEHLQPGSGSYDWQLGSALSRVGALDVWHISVYVRLHGTNSFSYHYGDDYIYNFGMLRRMSSSIAATLQLDGRYAKRDIDGGAFADNTGGSVLYFTPGVRVKLVPGASLVANVQIPVWENLYGVQSEKAVLNTGISVGL